MSSGCFLARLPYPVVLLHVPVQPCPKREEHAVTIPDLEETPVRFKTTAKGWQRAA